MKSSLVNSRIPFRAADYERPGLSLDEIQEIKQAFDLFDPEQTGFVLPKQLKASLASLGPQSKNQLIFQMIADLVEEGSTDINFDEFLDLMTARVSTKDTRSDLKKIFALFDDQKSGFISLKNLRKVMKELSENIDESELQEMIDKADTDNDGLVSEEQFYIVMTKKSAKK